MRVWVRELARICIRACRNIVHETPIPLFINTSSELTSTLRFDEQYQRTPWIDAACLGFNCEEAVEQSFNTVGKYMCVPNNGARYYGKIQT